MPRDKMTIDQLAEMSQKEFLAVRKEMQELRKEMRGGFNEMKELLGDVMNVAQATNEVVADIRTMRRVDLPVMENRIDVLEKDVVILKSSR